MGGKEGGWWERILCRIQGGVVAERVCCSPVLGQLNDNTGQEEYHLWDVCTQQGVMLKGEGSLLAHQEEQILRRYGNPRIAHTFSRNRLWGLLLLGRSPPSNRECWFTQETSCDSIVWISRAGSTVEKTCSEGRVAYVSHGASHWRLRFSPPASQGCRQHICKSPHHLGWH